MWTTRKTYGNHFVLEFESKLIRFIISNDGKGSYWILDPFADHANGPTIYNLYSTNDKLAQQEALDLVLSAYEQEIVNLRKNQNTTW